MAILDMARLAHASLFFFKKSKEMRAFLFSQANQQ